MTKFEDAIVDFVKAEARPGESAAGAFGRLQAAEDPRLAAMTKAAREAEEVEDLHRAQRGEELVSKRMRTRERAYSMMLDVSKARAREGEDAEDTLARLMGSGDPEIRRLLDVYNTA